MYLRQCDTVCLCVCLMHRRKIPIEAAIRKCTFANPKQWGSNLLLGNFENLSLSIVCCSLRILPDFWRLCAVFTETCPPLRDSSLSPYLRTDFLDSSQVSIYLHLWTGQTCWGCLHVVWSNSIVSVVLFIKSCYSRATTKESKTQRSFVCSYLDSWNVFSFLFFLFWWN